MRYQLFINGELKKKVLLKRKMKSFNLQKMEIMHSNYRLFNLLKVEFVLLFPFFQELQIRSQPPGSW